MHTCDQEVSAATRHLNVVDEARLLCARGMTSARPLHTDSVDLPLLTFWLSAACVLTLAPLSSSINQPLDKVER